MLQLRGVEDQLATTKTQIATLKRKLEEAEKAKVLADEARDKVVKAKDTAEQHGYDVGVAETEDSLRAKVLALCRTYYALVWDEALNQAEVEASSVLRKVESIYYPRSYALKALRTPWLTHPRLLLQLALLQRGQSRSRTPQRQGRSIEKLSKVLNYLLLLQGIPPRKKKLLKVWSWYWRPLPYLQKRILRKRSKCPPRQQVHNFPRMQKINL